MRCTHRIKLSTSFWEFCFLFVIFFICAFCAILAITFLLLFFFFFSLFIFRCGEKPNHCSSNYQLFGYDAWHAYAYDFCFQQFYSFISCDLMCWHTFLSPHAFNDNNFTILSSNCIDISFQRDRNLFIFRMRCESCESCASHVVNPHNDFTWSNRTNSFIIIYYTSRWFDVN